MASVTQEVVKVTTNDSAKENPNAIRIMPANGAQSAASAIIKTVRDSLGCHYHAPTRQWSCPITSQERVETLLKEKNIKAEIIPFHDTYFDKSADEKKADRIFDLILMKQKEHEEKTVELLHDEEKFDKEILGKEYTEEQLVSVSKIQKSHEKRHKELNDLKDEIEQLRNSAKLLEESQSQQQSKRKEVVKIPQNGLPVIRIIPGQIAETVDCAEKLLTTKNLGIFQRGGRLVRVIREVSKPKKIKLTDKSGHEVIRRDIDSLLITEVDPVYLTELLAKSANWTKYDERSADWIIKDCPERVANHLIARKEWAVPVLTGIIQAPTLRPDGSILDQPGYDEQTGLFFNPENISFPSISSFPSKEDALKALNLLCDLLKEFPFENEESKSVAISAILTALVRRSIRTAPLHGYTAPKMGTGKSLLADVVGLIATGKPNSVVAQAENEAEEQKRILALLSEGDPIICYDNIERPFGSATLCSVLTQEEFKGRVLGVSRNLTVPTNSTILATGNNLSFVGDISTRAILCRLDSQCERPEERDFNIDLRKYIPLNRGELVRASLTILRAYHVAGLPKQAIKPFGRFEEWSNQVRSSLVWLGMPDPCESRKEIENTDPVRQSLGNLLANWYAAVGDLSMRAKDAIKKAQDNPVDHEGLLDSLMEIAQKDNKICPRRLGKQLQAFNKRIENGYRLEKQGKYQNADLWKVKKI